MRNHAMGALKIYFIVTIVVLGVIVAACVLFPVAGTAPQNVAISQASAEANNLSASQFPDDARPSTLPFPTSQHDPTEGAVSLSLAVQLMPPPVEHEAVSSNTTILEERLPEGIYLTISSPMLPTSYRIGPLARGAHAMGPFNLFLVYLTNAGQVFGWRLGKEHFLHLMNLKHSITACHRNVDPSYELSFNDAGFGIFLMIDEAIYGQRVSVMLPRALTY